MKNRRNYYRILHVQPDAPLEIIKASYRTLMQKLGQHPDVGGSDEKAALINYAYGVLSDPKKRKIYDDQYFANSANNLGTPDQRASNEGTNKRKPEYKDKVPDPNSSSCLFCNTSISFTVSPETKCPNCHSPLHPVTRFELEKFSQRKVRRIITGGEITFFTTWPQPGLRAQVIDLSPTGMRFAANESLSTGTKIKISGERLESVAKVVNCHQFNQPPSSTVFSVGVEFMTLEFHQLTGTFVSDYA